MVGRVNSTVVPIGIPSSICTMIRIAMMMAPSTRKAEKVRPQGARGRRAKTTSAATAMMSPSTSGLVVLDAATAKPRAQAHHAPGCSHRASGRRATDGVTVVVISGRVRVTALLVAVGGSRGWR